LLTSKKANDFNDALYAVKKYQLVMNFLSA
jgi:hypothetical protein